MGQRSSDIRRRVGRALGLSLSLGLHGGVLAVLAVRLVPRAAATRPQSQAIQLDLTPEPTKTYAQPQARSRAEAAALRSASALSAGSPRLAAPPPRAGPGPVQPTTTTLAAPAPPGSETAASGAAKGASPWAVQGAGAHPAPLPGYAVGAGLQGLVRTTVGCTHADYLRLDAEEKAKCDKGYGEAARGGLKVDALPAEKRAYYDSVQKAYAMDHAAPVAVSPELGTRASQFGVAERWAGPPGSHMARLGCKIPLGVPRDWKSYRDKPPHSLKLGALPCFIGPPAGFGTEEADVEAPASLRERTDDAAHAAKSDPH